MASDDRILRIMLRAGDWRAIADQIGRLPGILGKSAALVFRQEAAEYSDAVSIPIERKASSWNAILTAHTDAICGVNDQKPSKAYQMASGPSDAAFGRLWDAVTQGMNRGSAPWMNR